MRKVITFNQVLELVPYTRGHIYRLIEKGEFPAPRKMGTKVVWYEDQIEDYIDNLPLFGDGEPSVA